MCILRNIPSPYPPIWDAAVTQRLGGGKAPPNDDVAAAGPEGIATLWEPLIAARPNCSGPPDLGSGLGASEPGSEFGFRSTDPI